MTGWPFGIQWKPGVVDLTTPPHVPLDLPTALLFLGLAIVAGVLARRRPSLGIAALVCLVPFAVARYVGPTTITLFKAGVIGVALGLLTRRLDLAAFRTPQVRWVLAALAAQIVSIALSASAAQHLGAVVREAGKGLEYATIFTVALVAYTTDPDDWPFWQALKMATALVCVGALAQYLVGAHSGIVLGGHAIPRIAGPLEGPNQLAGYLDIVLPLLLARNLLHRDGTLVAVTVIAALVDVLTFSRAGLGSVILGCALVLWYTRVPRSVGITFAAVTAVAVSMIAVVVMRAGAPLGYYSLSQEAASSTHLGNRAILWEAALRLWERSPWVGVGAGNYELDLDLVGVHGIRTHANNLYAQSLAETGILGLSATIATFISAIAALGASRLRRPVVVGALAATIALAFHQIFDDMFFFPKVASTYWLMLAIALAEITANVVFAERRKRVVV